MNRRTYDERQEIGEETRGNYHLLVSFNDLYMTFIYRPPSIQDQPKELQVHK